MTKKLVYATLAIVFMLFNVTAYAITAEKSSAFYIAYVFTLIAFIVQLFVWKIGIRNAKRVKSMFLGFPIIYVGVIYLFAQIVVCFLFMVIHDLTNSIAIIVCSLIFGISLVCMIASEIGREEIERVEVNVGRKVMFIKTVQDEIKSIANSEKETEIKKSLYKLAEKIRYSDPMSDDAIAEIEERIIDKVAELKSSSDKIAVIDEIATLNAERNRKCKTLK